MNLFPIFKPSPVLERSPDQGAQVRQAVGESLEDVLIELAKWGKPRVGQYGDDNMWHCSIDVNVAPHGIKFEAKSDFKQPTPLAAAVQCRKNLLEAVKTIGGKA